jgi:tripartite-type tricarboxylate transporter receptor subunit TctC
MLKKLLLTLTLLTTSMTYAFDSNKEPIQVIIPFSPGGGVDATFRSIATYANKQNIKLVPIYKPGAEGLIGMNELSKSKSDGSVIGIVTSGNIAIYRIKNNTDNIKPIIGIRNSPIAIVVNSNSRIKTLADYENAIINDANLSFGFAAPAQRMYFLQLLELMKIKNSPNMIPYKGGSNVVTDLLGGHITSAILPLNIVSKHIDSGALRLLATNSSTEYSNVTLLQTKYPAWQDFDWYCLVMPPDSSIESQKYWINFVKQYLVDPHTAEEFKQDNIEFVSKDMESAENTVKIFIKRHSLNQ